MLTLHYAPDNASLCVRLALDTIGLPYRTRLVDRRTREHKSPEYLKLNPMGLIPVLETPDGPLSETGAILLWLAERDARLIPGVGEVGRGATLKWLFWHSNTLHPCLRLVFYPHQYSETATDALRAFNRARLPALLDVLEGAPDAPWLDAGQATAVGCYLAPILRWSQLYARLPGERLYATRPRLAAFARASEAWPAMQAAARAEGLGPHPVTAPIPPDPPEGSAT